MSHVEIAIAIHTVFVHVPVFAKLKIPLFFRSTHYMYSTHVYTCMYICTGRINRRYVTRVYEIFFISQLALLVFPILGSSASGVLCPVRTHDM